MKRILSMNVSQIPWGLVQGQQRPDTLYFFMIRARGTVNDTVTVRVPYCHVSGFTLLGLLQTHSPEGLVSRGPVPNTDL